MQPSRLDNSLISINFHHCHLCTHATLQHNYVKTWLRSGYFHQAQEGMLGLKMQNLADKVGVNFQYNVSTIFSLLFGSLLVFLTATCLEPMDCLEIKQINKHFNFSRLLSKYLVAIENWHILSFPISHYCLIIQFLEFSFLVVLVIWVIVSWLPEFLIFIMFALVFVLF